MEIPNHSLVTHSETVVENGITYFKDTVGCANRTDTFKVIDIIPHGCVMWGIGRHNFPHENYIPLVFVNKEFSVVPNTPKYAVKLDSEEICLDLLKGKLNGKYLTDEEILQIAKEHLVK